MHRVTVPGLPEDESRMNRRNRLRFSTDMIASITGVDEPGISMKGRLANVSAHGLSLIVPNAIPSGVTVTVQWGSSRVVGQIIYCELLGNEYRAGLQVEDPIYDAGIALKNDESPEDTDLEVTGE